MKTVTTQLKQPHILKEFNTFFLSDILYLKVYDKNDKVIGYIDDIAIDIKLNLRHPFVSAFIIRANNKETIAVDDLSIAEYRLDYFKLINEPNFIQKPIPEDGEYENAAEILLKRDILDKQIVDTGGMRIVRVNDIKLTFVKSGIIAIGADIGPTGLMRRLSLERLFKAVASFFNKKIPDKILSWQFVEPIGTSGHKIKLNIPYGKLSLLHPADIADIMEELSVQESSEIFKSLDEETAAETLSEIDESELQLSLIESLDTEKAADILEMMPPDEVADILGDMPEHQAEEILSDMNSQGAEEVRELMSHDEDTAGGLMTTEYISFPDDFNVEQALSEFRLLAPNIETTYYLYVEEKGGYLKGVITLKNLIMARPFQKLTEIMNRKVVSALLTEHKDEVAEKIGRYNLLALPVVDENDILHGIVTLDDVIDIIVENKENMTHFMKGME
ncbi:MAG TPA: CBS domain-containing protein [Candidatus Wallbacteria bacterium]|nr:CBS domain-containing protein [Candidatus Wallbacteria bacterium]